MTHVQLLCWTTAESLDRLVKQKRLDQELCHQLLSLKDLVLGLRQILAQAEREFCALRRDKYADNYSESSRRPACRNLYLLEHAVLGIQDVLKPGGWLETLLVEDQSVLGWLRAFFTRGRRSVELLKALGERLESRITTHLLSS